MNCLKHTQREKERPCGVEGRSYKLMYGRECLETDVTEVRSCATSPMGGRNFNSRLIARGSLNSIFVFSSENILFLF